MHAMMRAQYDSLFLLGHGRFAAFKAYVCYCCLHASRQFSCTTSTVQAPNLNFCVLRLVIRHINARLDAVSELAGDLSPEADASRALMKKLPDVERLLSRVHSMASKHRSSEHPESRAIMYEDTKYSIRKVC